MRTGDLDANNDFLSALWFGGAWFRSIGSAGTTKFHANLAQGARMLRYGWPDVTEYRCRTAAEIAEVLRSQGWTGTLRQCGPGCTAVEPQDRDRAGRQERAGAAGAGGRQDRGG